MKSIVKSEFFIAALITLVAFILVLLFCDIKYETNDDPGVAAILSGAYNGKYNPHMLFSNVLLGYVLVFLYSHTSYISWYFVNLMIMGFASIFTVNYVCLKKNNRVVGVLFAVLATVFLSDDLFILPQFTKAASAIIAAGGLLLIETLWTQSEKVPSDNKPSASKIVSIILAFVLMLSGSLLRFNCVYLVAPFVAMMFLLKVLQQRKDEKIVRKVLPKAGFCLLLLLGLFMFELIGNYINNQIPEYREYYELNRIRASITDTGKAEYKHYEEGFNSLGLDGLDYIMLESWSFTDNDNYPAQRLEEIGKVYQSVFEDSAHPAERIMDEFSPPLLILNPVSMSSLMLGLLALAIDRKSAGRNFLCFWGYFVMLCAFIYMGRFPYRIVYGLGFSLFVSILSCVSMRDVPKKGLRKALVFLTAVLLVLHAPTYIKDQSYRNMPYNEYIEQTDSILKYEDYFGLKYRYVITAAKPYKNIIKHMENDSEHYYLCDVLSTCLTLPYYYAPWERFPLNYWNDNYSYFGGCSMGYPDNQECWEDNGIDGLNPYKSLINDNIYVVDNYFIEAKLQYLREHYYP
ncbi:MAG: hypothetical protein GX838_06925, partial [Clostridiaceae bacterium]|nr:hypothetical protein [Clostridiaceae bacterium]